MMKPTVPTREEIEKKIAPDGSGATRAVLAGWGVGWPPPKGWKKALLKQADEISGSKNTTVTKNEKTMHGRATDEVTADGFYTSAKWRKLRFDVLEHCGARCMCCGWTPNASHDGNFIVVDHIKSRRLNPELEYEFDNLQVLCNDCNLGKGRFKVNDFRSNGD